MLLKRVSPWVLSILITLLLAELALRMSGFPFLVIRTPSSAFWEENSLLGWSRFSNFRGIYKNAFFEGHVTTDEHGNRLNSASGTYIEGNENIFFIGDSTTASLEVDDQETIPALIEAELRARGNQVNVINLGVRGYGTDQSVRKALHFSELYQPTEVIYLYFDNDIYNNNTVRKPGRMFGKGVYIKRPGESEFSEYNYPVPHYDQQYGSLVVFDEACQPSLYEATLPDQAPRPRKQFTEWLRRESYLYRALGYVKRKTQAKAIGEDSVHFDPYVSLGPGKTPWHAYVRVSYEDNGLVRTRCDRYFDDQMHFLLEMLKSRIRSLERLHLVQFPDVSTIELLKRGKASPNVTLFSRMLEEGLIDSYSNIPQVVVARGIDVAPFRCFGDVHFCEEGNAWMSQIILDNLEVR